MGRLKGTETLANLMKAFAGESQARNRYTFFASKAKKEGYVQIQNIHLHTGHSFLLETDRPAAYPEF